MHGAREDGFVALIDDDRLSAHVLMRALGQMGCHAVAYLGGAEFGGARLGQILGDAGRPWPGLVVVDLKADSRANGAFVSRHQALLRQRGVALLVMINRHEHASRIALVEAGATGVFYRQADRDAYRREVEGILEYRARYPRLDAVGM